jgi:small subunit ribosomal protein S21
MIIVKITQGNNLERALKTLKSKVIKTKQNQILFDKREFTKKSVLRRAQILKAKYIQRKNTELN